MAPRRLPASTGRSERGKSPIVPADALSRDIRQTVQGALARAGAIGVPSTEETAAIMRQVRQPTKT